MQRGSVPTKKSWTWLNLCCNTTWLHPCWPITQMLLCIPGRLLRIFVRVAKSHHSLTLWRVSSLETRGSVCQTGPPFHCLTSSEVFVWTPPPVTVFPLVRVKMSNLLLTWDWNGLSPRECECARQAPWQSACWTLKYSVWSHSGARRKSCSD